MWFPQKRTCSNSVGTTELLHARFVAPSLQESAGALATRRLRAARDAYRRRQAGKAKGKGRPEVAPAGGRGAGRGMPSSGGKGVEKTSVPPFGPAAIVLPSHVPPASARKGA